MMTSYLCHVTSIGKFNVPYRFWVKRYQESETTVEICRDTFKKKLKKVKNYGWKGFLLVTECQFFPVCALLTNKLQVCI